jgi:hypothetical protein
MVYPDDIKVTGVWIIRAMVERTFSQGSPYPMALLMIYEETLEMLKKRIINWVIAAALLVALIGGVGIVADGLGLPVTAPAYACPASGSGGGGC